MSFFVVTITQNACTAPHETGAARERGSLTDPRIIYAGPAEDEAWVLCSPNRAGDVAKTMGKYIFPLDR